MINLKHLENLKISIGKGRIYDHVNISKQINKNKRFENLNRKLPYLKMIYFLKPACLFTHEFGIFIDSEYETW